MNQIVPLDTRNPTSSSSSSCCSPHPCPRPKHPPRISNHATEIEQAAADLAFRPLRVRLALALCGLLALVLRLCLRLRPEKPVEAALLLRRDALRELLRALAHTILAVRHRRASAPHHAGKHRGKTHLKPFCFTRNSTRPSTSGAFHSTSTSLAGVTSGVSNSFFASSQGHSSGTEIPPFFFLPSSAASSFAACLTEAGRRVSGLLEKKGDMRRTFRGGARRPRRARRARG